MPQPLLILFTLYNMWMLPGCQPKCFLTSKGVHVAAFLQPNTPVDHHHEKLHNINAHTKHPTEGPCNAAIY